jgi:type IV secretion system protein TrbL
METGILTETLNRFAQVCSLGYGALLPDALRLMSYFVVLEIVVLGVFWALGKGDIAVTAIQKLTAIGFFLFVVSNMGYLSNVLIKSFAKAGLIAGGGSLSVQNLFDPSAIVDFGLQATEPIFATESSLVTFFIHPFDNMFKGLAGIIIILAYALIACQLFITILEFYLFSLCAMILIPFSVFRPTAWLGERAIGAVFSISVKMMVLGLVISLAYNTLKTLNLPVDCDVKEVCVMMVISGTLALLCWHAPTIAAQYLSGSPSLSFQSFIGPAATLPLTGYYLMRSSASTRQTASVNQFREASLKGTGARPAGAPPRQTPTHISTRGNEK